MLEVLTDEEDNSLEEGSKAAGGNEIRNSEFSKGNQTLWRGGTRYYNRKQQLELVLAAQGLLDDNARETSDARSEGEEVCVDNSSQTDIWEDAVCMGWLKDGFISEGVDLQESKRVNKQAKQYCWKDGKLYFKGLYVPKPKDRLMPVTQMHEDLGHFGE
jgi:hypothetical protein